MPYVAKTWKDGYDGGTPINAVELNRMESGIATATSVAETAKGLADAALPKAAMGSATSESALKVLIAAEFRKMLPVGSGIIWYTNTAPAGFLLCHGQSLSRTQYPELFALLGTTYGSTSATTFNLPDIRGRVAVAKAATGLFSTLGAKVGEDAHTLTVEEMPAHSHRVTIGGTNASAWATSLTANGNWRTPDKTGSGALDDVATAAVGGSKPHSNVQASLVVNYAILAG